METLYLETDFGRIYGRAAGNPDDELILGIHGWSQRNGWHTWQRLMDPLADAGYYVVSIDMPGWGQSTAEFTAPINPELAQGTLVAVLDTLEATKPCVLLGKSWGGGLALTLALNKPDRVAKLILTAPAFSDFERLSGLQQPVLLAWAKDDPVIPYEFARRYIEAVPSVKLVTYDHGGHNAVPENAAAFAPVAIEFLS